MMRMMRMMRMMVMMIILILMILMMNVTMMMMMTIASTPINYLRHTSTAAIPVRNPLMTALAMSFLERELKVVPRKLSVS